MPNTLLPAGKRPAGLARALLATSRPVSWVNTAYPFAAAYLLGSGRIDWLFVVGTLFFLFPYNLAMYGINDVFDHESDLRNPRKGGAEGALLDRSRHRAILVSCAVATVPFIVALVAGGTLGATLVLAVSLFAVYAYSAPGLRFKERPFLDSATSSTHFVSPAVYGAVLAGTVFTPGLWALLAAFFLWGMASHAFGAVQDVLPDREAGLGSVATVLGARRTAWLSAGAYLAAGALMLATDRPGPLAALLALPYVANVAPFLRIDDAGSPAANAGWRRFLWLNYLTGFLVTLLLIWYALIR
ncbi:prenyltransferase [Arthrobacter ginkgonis]|uniref:Prenyltransferase n=1 Tax=Arthrobacter ginkgonis TaxID=1630594 RepID=A0ABP7C1Q7_9MICC